MEIEGEKLQKTRKHHNKVAIKTKPKDRWFKTYVKKEMMAIEKIEDAEAVSNSLPKRNPDVKPKSKGAPSSLKGKERGEKRTLQRRASEARN